MPGAIAGCHGRVPLMESDELLWWIGRGCRVPW